MPAEPSASAGFIDKWLQREPAFVQASLFVARDQRQLFAHWGALLFCLREAAFELSDPSLRLTKSAWWARELIAITTAQAQHPLAQAFAVHPQAPWPELSAALLHAAGDSEPAPHDSHAALAQMHTLASAMVAVEAALLGGTASASATRLAAIHLLAQRLWVGQSADDAGRVPLQLLARHQVSRSAIRDGKAAAAVADYAGELLLLAPADSAAVPLFRRMQWVLDRDVLACLAAGKPPRCKPGMRSLWRFWRAARGAL